jgi:hypothetical protein
MGEDLGSNECGVCLDLGVAMRGDGVTCVAPLTCGGGDAILDRENRTRYMMRVAFRDGETRWRRAVDGVDGKISGAPGWRPVCLLEVHDQSASGLPDWFFLLFSQRSTPLARTPMARLPSCTLGPSWPEAMASIMV